MESQVWAWLDGWVPGTPFQGRAFVVGGCVRDRLLGEEPHDLDLVVESPGGAKAFVEAVHAAWPEHTSRPHGLGAGYPIWQLVFCEGPWAGVELQVADTQKEMFPDPTTRQRVTRYGSLDEDCARRDFTVNMLYWELGGGETGLRDPSQQGLKDLRAGVLQGHPQVSLSKIFADDPLRMLRLARFRARFGWTVPDSVRACVREHAQRVEILSAERVRDELLKACQRGGLAPLLEFCQETGLLQELFPELEPLLGCTQDRFYHAEGDVWVHTLEVLRQAPLTPLLQLAALLHDLGKPATRAERADGRVTFLGHEKISESLGRAFLARWRFGKDLSEQVCLLVRLHLRGGDAASWASVKPARKLMREAGDLLPALLQLIEADSRASLGPDLKPRLEHLDFLRERLNQAALQPPSVRSLLSGREIMELLGLPPGPRIGHIKAWLQDQEDEAAARGEVLDADRARALLLKADLE